MGKNAIIVGCSGEYSPLLRIILLIKCYLQMGNMNLSFTGEFEYSLDKKNRLIIPARFRKSLGDINDKTFVLTRGLDDCLTLYPLNEWNNVERQLGQLSTIKEKNRNFIRNVVRYAAYLKYDGQGRIAIPTSLLSHAKIKKEVVLIGMIKKIEIWDTDVLNKASYDNYTSSKDFEELANEIDF